MQWRRLFSTITLFLNLLLLSFAQQPVDLYLRQLPAANSTNGNNIPEPAPPSAGVRDFFDLDPFYEQWINVAGLPVLASAQVNPYAVKEAAWLIEQMIGHRPDVLRTMAGNKARFSVIAQTEIITEIPEYRSDARPDFLVFQERGWGGTEGATVTSSEENILSYPGGGTYNVMIHEFAHGIHLLGLNTLDPTFDERLRRTYEAAMKKGLWSGTYASSDRREYWAEASQAWFNPNTPGSFSRFGNTRQALKRYDPGIAALLTEIYGDRNYRYTHIKTRLHLPHLHGFDPQNSPVFQGWPELEALYEQLRTDPTSDGGGAWVNLKLHPPAQLARLTQANSLGTASAIIFVNFGQTDVLLYGIHSDGTEGYWTRVPPGYVRGTPSRINEIWLVKDLNGRNIAVFQTQEKAGRATIGIPPPQVVSIRDANLASAVRKALRLGNNTLITNRHMLKLSELDAQGSKIKNLTGLEHAKQLTRLQLDRNQIRKLNPLSGLTRLKTLTLDENQISDVRPLTKLTQLEWLLIGGNPIKNAGVQLLAGLKHLRGLSLYRCQIGNITPLAKLTKLESLWLDDNQIRDVSPLSGLTHLRTLHLGDNRIRDVSPIGKLTELTSLRLAGNPIEDVGPLANLRNLEDVDIEIPPAAPALPAAPPPEVTQLLGNYPNPFNPETWIPYELATDTDVRITIYNTQGVVIRTLELGHQAAGYYTSRSRAAYWDGRNALGEPVASGVYFYTLTAGEFTATRKMLIRK